MLISILKACRPQTLPIGVLPIVITYLLVVKSTPINTTALFCCLISVILLQSASNLINDAEDGKNGHDKERVGPERMVGSESLTSTFVIKVSFFLLGLSVITSLPLFIDKLYLSPLLIISIFGAYSYTAGPFPFSYKGLGELAAFIFFGPIAIMGTTLVFGSNIEQNTIILSFFLGLGAALILGLNNLRDIYTDEISGKKTLAVRIGEKRFIAFLCLIIILKIFFFYNLVINLKLPTLTLLPALLPFALLIKLLNKNSNGPVLFKMGLLSFLTCSISLIVSLAVI